jgi:hypothetical protein
MKSLLLVRFICLLASVLDNLVLRKFNFTLNGHRGNVAIFDSQSGLIGELRDIHRYDKKQLRGMLQYP